MKRDDVMAWLRRDRLVPVVRARSADEVRRIVEALLEGGISILEVTMTVPGAVGVIAQIAAQYGDRVLLGAGTVVDPETARACVDAGAVFIVSPALDVPTVEACREMEVLVSPGALTPTEVLTAHRAGADVVKIFPCDALGGASYLKSLKAPFPHIPLMPTGGVTLATIGEFLQAGAEAVGVGSALVDPKLSHSELVERARLFLAAREA